MQTEDRVLPYNDKKMLNTWKIIFLILLLVSNMFQKYFKVNVSILDGIATIYYVAIYRFTIKTVMSYLEIGFPS